MKTAEQKARAVLNARRWKERHADKYNSPEARAKRAAQAKAWREKHPEKLAVQYREGNLQRTYGISIAQYDQMLVGQKGVCAICCETCPSGRRLAVDHNHQTGEVRGLLCGRCNSALGALRESPELFMRAMEYLSITVG